MSGIVDCEMHIGDEVFIHGYIDEIRNDVVIIRNVGGYFGTSRDEVFYYEADEYGSMNSADRKTEPSDSGKPNNFDKDTNVRSKDCETCRHYTLACDLFSEICRYEPKTEPQIIACPIQEEDAEYARWLYEDELQTDLLVKTPRKSRESHEKETEPQTVLNDYSKADDCMECEKFFDCDAPDEVKHASIVTDCAWKEGES